MNEITRTLVVVYLKQHPVAPPTDTDQPFEYLRKYFPHFRHDAEVNKFIIPIRPGFHKVLFPDYLSYRDRQIPLFTNPNSAGNAIKLAYICHAQTRNIRRGDLALFYRSFDERSLTSIGVVEDYSVQTDPDAIASRVKRRTVYKMSEIQAIAKKPTKVMLFRLVRHFNSPPTQAWLEEAGVLKGAPQSITWISHEAFRKVIANAD